MVIAVTQAALSVLGYPFITENLTEHFLLTQSSVPQRKYCFYEEGPLSTNKSTGPHTRSCTHNNT